MPLITIFVTEFFFDLEEYEKLFLVILSLAPGAFLSTAFVTAESLISICNLLHRLAIYCQS